jgi:hypothetical protein
MDKIITHSNIKVKNRHKTVYKKYYERSKKRTEVLIFTKIMQIFTL